MVPSVLETAGRRLFEQGERKDDFLRVKTVTASRGEILRCEPIAASYEQGKVLHRPGLDLLESSFSRQWNRSTDGSPGRLDAAVWALSHLSTIVMNISIV